MDVLVELVVGVIEFNVDVGSDEVNIVVPSLVGDKGGFNVVVSVVVSVKGPRLEVGAVIVDIVVLTVVDESGVVSSDMVVDSLVDVVGWVGEIPVEILDDTPVDETLVVEIPVDEMPVVETVAVEALVVVMGGRVVVFVIVQSPQP